MYISGMTRSEEDASRSYVQQIQGSPAMGRVQHSPTKSHGIKRKRRTSFSGVVPVQVRHGWLN